MDLAQPRAHCTPHMPLLQALTTPYRVKTTPLALAPHTPPSAGKAAAPGWHNAALGWHHAAPGWHHAAPGWHHAAPGWHHTAPGATQRLAQSRQQRPAHTNRPTLSRPCAPHRQLLRSCAPHADTLIAHTTAECSARGAAAHSMLCAHS